MSLVFEISALDSGGVKKDNVCSSQLWLAPSSILTASLSSGDLVVVGVVGIDDDLVSLPDLSASYFSVTIPWSGADVASRQGTHLAVATVWSSTKLTRNSARLSRQLADSCGRPSVGTRIKITPLFILLPTRIPPSSPSSQCTGAPRHATSAPPSLPSGTLAAVDHEAASVTLLWCRHVCQSADAVPPCPSPSCRASHKPFPEPELRTPRGKGGDNASTSDASTPGRSPRPAAWQPRGGRQSPQTPGRAPPCTPPESERKGKAASNPEGHLARWESVGEVLGGRRGHAKEMVEKYAANWLWGRQLMVGNVVMVPICGQDCLFRVIGAEGYEDAPGSECFNRPLATQGGESDTPISLWRVSYRTTVVLLGGDEDSSSQDLTLDRRPKGGQREDGISPAEAPVEAGEVAQATAETARVRFSALGGLANQIAALRELVELPLRSPQLYERFGVRPPRGVLLYGPPGTGKTTLAQAVATESGASMFTINGPEIVSEFYGESEHALRAVFERARKAAPSVVFIDELDAIAPARADGSEELTQRMVGALLTLMDGGDGENGRPGQSRVVVIAATNRPDTIDPALRRPGRFDREIEIGVPSPAGRREILVTRLGTMPHALSELDIDGLATATHGFVGADLAALCNVAALNALRRIVRSGRDPMAKVGAPLGLEYGLSTGGRSAEDKLRPLAESISRLSLEAGSRGGRDGESTPVEGEDDVRGIRADVEESERLEVACPQDPATRRLEVPRLERGSAGGLGTGEGGAREEARSLGSADAEATGQGGEDDGWRVVVGVEDFEAAKARVGPSAMREVMIEVPKVRWADVGGQETVKQRLQEAVEWPQKHAEAFARVGARPPAGILLYGAPGCSKTLLARAVATEAGLNFIAVKGPELFSKWVGESEKGVRALFARARSAAPAVVFLDEVDSLVVRRGIDEDGSGVNERVMSQLLQEMDGLNPRSNVTVLAATNRPEVLDPALLRPGRFDRLLYVAPPDERARRQIFDVHLRMTPVADDVDIAELARRTHGHTGADISAVCREAAIAALEEDLGASRVTMKHFEAALKLVTPSNPPDSREWYMKFQRGGATDI